MRILSFDSSGLALQYLKRRSISGWYSSLKCNLKISFFMAEAGKSLSRYLLRTVGSVPMRRRMEVPSRDKNFSSSQATSFVPGRSQKPVAILISLKSRLAMHSLRVSAIIRFSVLSIRVFFIQTKNRNTNVAMRGRPKPIKHYIGASNIVFGLRRYFFCFIGR